MIFDRTRCCQLEYRPKIDIPKDQGCLELENANEILRIQELMPQIMDNFQVYLRELSIEDLKGSAGMYRLREESDQGERRDGSRSGWDVLFKEMLVQ